MYVELDSSLIPRKIKDINDISGLQTKEFEPDYHVKSGQDIDFYLQSQDEQVVGKRATILDEMKEDKLTKEFDMYEDNEIMDVKIDIENKNPLPSLEKVLGLNKEIKYDHDWGFFSTILACYNNHWSLKTSPDDWWNVIVRNISQAVDDHGGNNKVRDFFVSHDGQKEIKIMVPSMIGLDYSWLFEQFSVKIRENLKTPGYVDLMQADFSTTTPDKLISTQVMLMASVQKYFKFVFSTRCGIPGVEMIGTEDDWLKLIEKTEQLEKTLMPILEVLEMTTWFKSTKDMLSKLLDTFRNKPNITWWGHILTWTVRNGSGKTNSWDGWMIKFLMAGEAESPANFKSGVVSLPVGIIECLQGPRVEDTGRLVAGTLGFTIQEGEHGKPPSVEASQGWALLLPKDSKVTPRLLGTFKAMPHILVVGKM